MGGRSELLIGEGGEGGTGGTSGSMRPPDAAAVAAASCASPMSSLELLPSMVLRPSKSTPNRSALPF
jgi:hypothetical protein